MAMAGANGGRTPRSRTPRIKPPLAYDGLLELAVRSLAARMRSERDLRRRLQLRAEPGEAGAEAIGLVIARLHELHYLDDTRFAADYTRTRLEGAKLGRRRVQQGLAQKGIAAPVADAALGTAYSEVDEVALATAYVARKRMQRPTDDKQTAKTMRRLLAAGFSSKAIWKVLRQWGTATEEIDIEEIDVQESFE